MGAEWILASFWCEVATTAVRILLMDTNGGSLVVDSRPRRKLAGMFIPKVIFFGVLITLGVFFLFALVLACVRFIVYVTDGD